MEEFANEPALERRNNAYGSTTLKQCGWCEYASGSHRYNYCISGRCSLDKSYNKEVNWKDSCKFLDASKADVDAIINNHKWQIESATGTILRHKEYTKILKRLKNGLPERPALPDDRKGSHFEIDAPVRVWLEGNWVKGVVKYGYRHQDGRVSYKLEGRGPQEVEFWGQDISTPTILLESEWQFFANNPSEYKVWSEKAYDKKFNGLILNIAPIN